MKNETQCKVTDCDSKIKAHDLCNKHLQRFKKYGDPLALSPSRIAPTDTKVCADCKQEKPVSEFAKRQSKTRPDTDERGTPWRVSYCNACNSMRVTAYKFGMSVAEYRAMFAAQDGKCVICGGVSDNDKLTHVALVVDHNHTTGKVRKLLCMNCNTGLGMFQDNPALLQKASEYLLSHSSSLPSGHGTDGQ